MPVVVTFDCTLSEPLNALSLAQCKTNGCYVCAAGRSAVPAVSLDLNWTHVARMRTDCGAGKA